MENEHLYHCFVLSEGRIQQVHYLAIFKGTLSEQKTFINILEENIKKHNKLTSAQDLL